MLVKRIFDVVVSFVGLLLLLPIFLMVAAVIKLGDPGSVFFKQCRIGKNGKEFKILKFRTMKNLPSTLKVTTADDPRITSVGRWLRKYKLDELPQLINVLWGDMSLVGPRPEVPEFVAHYPEEIKSIVLSVLPGITDDAAIKFSDENSLLAHADDPAETYILEILPKKLEMYKAYVESQSFWRDIYLILLTIKKIVR
ncbi:MAG: sugar transferase [Mariprofundaceae bacterium]